MAAAQIKKLINQSTSAESEQKTITPVIAEGNSRQRLAGKLQARSYNIVSGNAGRGSIMPSNEYGQFEGNSDINMSLESYVFNKETE